MAEEIQQGQASKQEYVVPDDVLIDILLRLPVRSILLCKSVCKRWLSLIKNPYFIQLHCDRPIYKNNGMHDPMLVLRDVNNINSLSSPLYSHLVLTLLNGDETLNPNYKEDVELALLSPSMVCRRLQFYLSNNDKHIVLPCVSLIGPCNGVFCITDMVDIVLFNPATRQSRHLPSSPLEYLDLPSEDCYVSFGFGLDPVSNDYIVIKFDPLLCNDIVEFEDGVECVSGDGNRYSHDLHLKLEIFRLRTGSWEELNCVLPAGPKRRIICNNFFFNGAFHWWGAASNDIDSILVFDLNKSGTFKWFELPCIWTVEDAEGFVCFTVCNEFLAVIVQEAIDVNIWVMKEYGVHGSWMKLYNNITFTVGIRKIFLSGKEGEFLFENTDGHLMSFNFKTMAIKELQVHNIGESMQAYRYRESLASLE